VSGVEVRVIDTAPNSLHLGAFDGLQFRIELPLLAFTATSQLGRSAALTST
jgi:hypothetical protein